MLSSLKPGCSLDSKCNPSKRAANIPSPPSSPRPLKRARTQLEVEPPQGTQEIGSEPLDALTRSKEESEYGKKREDISSLPLSKFKALPLDLQPRYDHPIPPRRPSNIPNVPYVPGETESKVHVPHRRRKTEEEKRIMKEGKYKTGETGRIFELGLKYKSSMAPSSTALSSFNSYARDIDLYPTPFVDGYVAPLPPTPQRDRPAGWISPAQRLSEEILENIFNCLHDRISEVTLPCVPINGRDAWVGTLTNDRLTNGEIEAYKTAVMRKMLYDYGRVCKMWWAGSQKGWSDIVIIGEKDAERAINQISHWVPIGSTRHLSLTLQMTIPSVYLILKELATAIHARYDANKSTGILPTSQASVLRPPSARPVPSSKGKGLASYSKYPTSSLSQNNSGLIGGLPMTQLPLSSSPFPLPPTKPLIPLRKLTILHSFEPEQLGKINIKELQKAFALFAPDHLHFEAFSGENVIERRSLDTVARALRFPWGYFGTRRKYRVAIELDKEEDMVNTEEGAKGRAFVEVLQDGNFRRKDELRRQRLEIRNRRVGNMLPIYRGPVQIIEMDTRVKMDKGERNMEEEDAMELDEKDYMEDGDGNYEDSEVVDEEEIMNKGQLENSGEVDEEEMMNGTEEGKMNIIKGDKGKGKGKGKRKKGNTDIVNDKPPKKHPWLVDHSEYDRYPLPKDRIAGFIFHLENKYLGLPPPHLKNLSPGEVQRKEIWAELFGENEDITNEFAEADKVWREVADNAMKHKGWIPPLGWKVNSKVAETVLIGALETWLKCLEGLTLRAHWIDLYKDLRKSAKNGALSSFDYHFIPLPSKVIQRNEKGQRGGKYKYASNPPLGATKSVDNVLMWDFAERPTKWTRKTEHQMAKAEGTKWIEPPPRRTLFWTLHVPFDMWLQQKDRAHFKGKGKARPWLPETEEEMLQALRKFIMEEGDKWDIPLIAEKEEWDNLRYFHEMVNFVLNVTTRMTKPSYPLRERNETLLDISRGRILSAEWISDRIAKANPTEARAFSQNMWIKREEEWWNEPYPEKRRREWNEDYLDHYLTNIGKEGREVIFEKLKKKFGAKQLWQRCHWNLKHQDYPGVTIRCEVRKE